MPDINLFVYGTLLRGQNSHGLLQNPVFVGEAYLSGYSLFGLGDYPGIVEASLQDRVLGEVYRINATLLPELDRYEDEGDLYTRKTLEVTLSDRTRIQAETYVYNLPVDPQALIPLDCQPYCRF
jgi:gamma-glutamylcyclotransferase (GGCT)/AIG2-like uncharacterized protein YtfP